MKTKFNGIFTLLLALIVQISFAQEKTISGTVSEETGPLPGVSVLNKNTKQGTETDFDGNYSIKAKIGDTLVFSFVGMTSVEKIVGTSNKINATMATDNVLEEVVITAYGVKREKKAIGFAQQSVGGSELTKAKETDVSNALAGKVSGVQIVGNTSSTFGNSQIRLRGETDVLYVVDGIRIHSTGDINTENIADISVLKGASATAIYGPDGRNGVVVITTKTAKKGETSISFDVNTSVNSIAVLPEYQNEYGGGYSLNFNTFKYDSTKHPSSWASFDGQKYPEFNADESWGPKLDGTLVRHWDSWIPNTPEFGELRPWSPTQNDIDSFYEDAITNNYTVAFSKADEDYNLRTTLSHVKANGVVPNSNRTSTKLSINLSYDINEKLTFFTNINYEDRFTLNNPEQNYGNLASNFNQWWQRQLDFNRLRNYERNGSLVSWNIGSPTNLRPLYWDMPHIEAYENFKNSYKNSVFGKIGGTYKFNDNLTLTAETRQTFNNYRQDDRSTTKSLKDPSRFAEFQQAVKRKTYFAMLNYNDKFLEGDLDLDASLGAESISDEYNLLSIRTNGGLGIPDFYNLGNSLDPITYRDVNQNAKRKSERRGMFLKSSFGYKNTAYFDASYRIDYSSTANANDNRVDTYGLSLSLLAHKLFSKNDILSFSKLRVGYASAPYFPDIYSINSVYSINNQFNGNGRISVDNQQSNPILKGGVREELEAGTELQFLKNRFSIDFTYFSRKDKELPVEVSLDGATGYSSIVLNSGQTTSKGIELGLSSDIIKNDNFTWSLGVNFATLSKKVDELYTNIKSRNISEYTSNLLLQERVGYDWGLLYGTGFAKHTDGSIIYRENNGEIQYARHRNKFLGDILPDYTGGINTNFSYKNLDLSLGFDFQEGGRFYSRTERYYDHSGLSPKTVGVNDKGNPIRNPVADGGGVRVRGVLQTGTDKDGVPISDGTIVDKYVNPKDLYNLGNLGNIYENNIHDASYIKLRTIRLNYNFSKNLIERINLKSASLGFYANNVWLISSEIPWIDPSELEKIDDINWAENGQLPMSRTIGFNLNLTF